MGMIKKSVGIAVFLLFSLAIAGSAAAQTDAVKGPDVLIIYSTGNVPPAGMREDAVTTPTPAKENMKTVSEKLAAALVEKKLTVRLAPVSEKITPDDIMASRMVVMGSPSYWSNVSWQMKKYIDEQFTPFFLRKDHMNKLPAAAFSMAEVEPSAVRTIGVLKDLIVQNNGKFGPVMIVLGHHGPDEIAKRVAAFADSIAAFIQ